MRVVLDTNVIISAIVFGGVPEKVVTKILHGPHEVVLSPYVVEEVNRVLIERFDASPTSIDIFNHLIKVAEMKYFQPFLNIVKDDPDNRIIETALKGQANLIITGDKLLLELKRYENIVILPPADVMKLLRTALQ